MITPRFASFSIAIMLAWNVQATVISYDVLDLGAGTWQYDYTVTNDTLSSPIEEFTIYFPLGLYSNLSSVDQPIDWSSIVVEPDPNLLPLPADGFFDSTTLAAAISTGATLSPFSVQFSWLGAGTPGTQSFDIVDPTTFSTLDSGITEPSVMSVPEPGSLNLAILGIAAMAVIYRQRKVTSHDNYLRIMS
jgi:hypothetical protein